MKIKLKRNAEEKNYQNNQLINHSLIPCLMILIFQNMNNT